MVLGTPAVFGLRPLPSVTTSAQHIPGGTVFQGAMRSAIPLPASPHFDLKSRRRYDTPPTSALVLTFPFVCFVRRSHLFSSRSRRPLFIYF